MFLAYPDKDVAEHIAVPKRTSPVLGLKHPFAVIVGHELLAELVAQAALNGIVKILCTAVNVDVPVLAAAVLAEICYAFEFFVKGRINI